MSEAADFRIFALENPDRMVIDFESAEWQAGPPRSPRIGVIAGHRHGIREDGSIRVVLDLTGPARVLDSFYLPSVGNLPFRFVLDLAPEGASAGRSDPAPPPTPAPPAPPTPVMPAIPWRGFLNRPLP